MSAGTKLIRSGRVHLAIKGIEGRLEVLNTHLSKFPDDERLQGRREALEAVLDDLRGIVGDDER